MKEVIRMKIPVGVSARHIHLTKESFIKLFGDIEIEKRNDLTQPGEFATTHTVTIKTEKSEIANVRFLGPLRKYNQVEISKTDAVKLGLNPPVRRSGDVEETPGITLIGPNGELVLEKGVIIAERHIHMTREMAENFGIKDKYPVAVTINGTKGMYKDKLSERVIAFVKVMDTAYLEMHIDTDDANAFLLNSKDEVDVDL